MSDFYHPMPYTEQQIRGLAINFLRFHYKLRPRFGGSGTRVVDKPHYYQGVLIDARLAYQKPDRSYFTATVEATSVDRSEEILYQVNYWRMGLHVIVLTLAVIALILWAGLPPFNLLPNLWERVGSPAVYGFLTLLVAGVAAGILALLRRMRTYRYIYAVDQFKHFFADAQWVAYDSEIFAADTWRTRRKYRELKRQCVRYGFGMLAVEADNVVQNVISPSQVDQFRGHRIRLPGWLARAKARPETAVPALPAEPLDPLAVDRPEVILLPPTPGRPRFFQEPRRRGRLLRARVRRWYRGIFPSSLRRRPGYYKVGWWVFLVGVPALLLTGWGMYRQASYTPLAREDGRYAQPDLDMLENAADPAPPLDPETGEYQRPAGGAVEDDAPVELPEDLVARERIEDLALLKRYRLSADGQATADYECVPLAELGEPVFVLLFGEYPAFETARSWALELNRLYASPVTVAAGDCIRPGEPNYWLYIDAATPDEGRANYLARTFIRASQLDVELVEIK